MFYFWNISIILSLSFYIHQFLYFKKRLVVFCHKFLLYIEFKLIIKMERNFHDCFKSFYYWLKSFLHWDLISKVIYKGEKKRDINGKHKFIRTKQIVYTIAKAKLPNENLRYTGHDIEACKYWTIRTLSKTRC